MPEYIIPYVFPGLMLAAGFAVLIAGGEALVRGASALAAIVRISPLVIGLTVVAFGTSAPELAVTVQSSFMGRTELAVGNVVGSNICNVLLVLGLSALVMPLIVSSRLVRIDVPLMIFISFLLLAFGFDGKLGRVDGLILFSILLCYTLWSIIQGRREAAPVKEQFEKKGSIIARAGGWNVLVQVAWILVGLGLLVLGSQLIVKNAVDIAELLGISDLMIGLTIVAFGTSLPELAASLLAICRGERDIAVGNVVGSNMLNILGVLGLSSMVAPGGLNVEPEAVYFHIPVMIVTAMACLPIFFTGHLIARWEGAVFFGYYLAYMAYLILSANQDPSVQTYSIYSIVMLAFVIPLTLITIVARAMRAFGRRNAADSRSSAPPPEEPDR